MNSQLNFRSWHRKYLRDVSSKENCTPHFPLRGHGDSPGCFRSFVTTTHGTVPKSPSLLTPYPSLSIVLLKNQRKSVPEGSACERSEPASTVSLCCASYVNCVFVVARSVSDVAIFPGYCRINRKFSNDFRLSWRVKYP